MGGVMTKSESQGTKKFSETSPCIKCTVLHKDPEMTMWHSTSPRPWHKGLPIWKPYCERGSFTKTLEPDREGGGGYKTCSSRGESLLFPSPLTQSLTVNYWSKLLCYVTQAWVDRAMHECTPGWVCVVIGVVITPGYCIIFTMNYTRHVMSDRSSFNMPFHSKLHSFKKSAFTI